MAFFTSLQDTSLLSGGISAQQVVNMRDAMLADGKIQDSEAEFLFTLKENFKGRDNTPEWSTFWVEAMLLFLHNEDNSINDTRLAWLKGRIVSDGTDELEQQLLNSLAV